MAISILSVRTGSLADQAGLKPGDLLLSINGEEILDEIDYQALSISPRLRLSLKGQDGTVREISLRKKAGVGLGIQLDERIVLSPRVCQNHCVFCFVDQMPPHMRSSLYVKDDDWRLSLMMGNFVTLTNVDDREFERILRRKASPLYISVHATDPEVRVRMLRNPRAGQIMDQLRRMKEAGLKFHTQVVLCPEINDGAVLHQTIVDLAGLFPAAQSLAVVPIGLTGHREHLPALRLFSKEEAVKLLRDVTLIQDYYLRTLGTRFVFPADEFYSLAGYAVPGEENYEGFPQIENGIGMLRLLIQECENAWPLFAKKNALDIKGTQHHGKENRLLIPTGVSAFPYIKELTEKYASSEDRVEVFSVANRFFGPSVTVTGLITGQDLIQALKGKKGDRVLISCSMLRENGDTFLDDLTVADVEDAVGIPLRVVQNKGEDFLRALYE